MTTNQKKIVNKIRFLVKLEAWNELNKDKYYKYLAAPFSCKHCKFQLAAVLLKLQIQA